MSKPKGLDAKTRAIRAIKKEGVAQRLVDELERAVLHEVMDHAGIGGNASEYVLHRIAKLEG